MLNTVGSIHYLKLDEIEKNKNYLKIDRENKKIVAFIIGGPNNYYNYSENQVNEMFNKVKTIFTQDKYKLIIIPSYRTPPEIIKMAFNTFSHNHMVIKTIDKKAYMSALALSDYIIVTCDSTSMISEAAMTGKPIYIANMKARKHNIRFLNFFDEFKKLNIIKDLEDRVDLWSYNKLDEVNRIAPLIKERIKNHDVN